MIKMYMKFLQFLLDQKEFLSDSNLTDFLYPYKLSSFLRWGVGGGGVGVSGVILFSYCPPIHMSVHPSCVGEGSHYLAGGI